MHLASAATISERFRLFRLASRMLSSMHRLAVLGKPETKAGQRHAHRQVGAPAVEQQGELDLRKLLMKLGQPRRQPERAEGGVAAMDASFVSHFDKCLGCMACMTACPSGVQYGKLIEATRAQIERNYQRPLLDRLFRKLIFAVFPYPKRLRWLMLPFWFYQRSGLRWLIRASRLCQLFPERLRSMESLRF